MERKKERRGKPVLFRCSISTILFSEITAHTIST
jgi:hypothetical protein